MPQGRTSIEECTRCYGLQLVRRTRRYPNSMVSKPTGRGISTASQPVLCISQQAVRPMEGAVGSPWFGRSRENSYPRGYPDGVEPHCSRGCIDSTRCRLCRFNCSCGECESDRSGSTNQVI